MEILYISNTTSQKYFTEIYEICSIKPGQQVQKFNNMLLRGLSAYCHVTAVSVVPVSRATCSQKAFPNAHDEEDNVEYNYVGFINFPIIKQLCVKRNAKKKIKEWVKSTKGKDRIIICYALSPTLSSIALKLSEKYDIQCMAVVTDIPQLINFNQNTTGIKERLYRIYSKSTYEKMIQYDLYMLLTSAMNDIINPYNKPSIVIEGMVDNDMNDIAGDVQSKYEPNIILYAGALFEKYGVLDLVEGFLSAELKNCELWVYGSGEMNDCFDQLNNDTVKFFGVVPNKEIIEHELRATLLVNPRPSNEEFTKYSFPSKNLEYMASGTPILTCNLPGMPKEYLEYVYIAEDETKEGFKNSLIHIMGLNENDRNLMGENARTFVLEHKSNIQQARKITDFIKKHLS
ncbi:MAG: glycosyltransferase [Clostridiales bacterium]|nr:glycosyltransferase [Clostridiales bacterium]